MSLAHTRFKGHQLIGATDLDVPCRDRGLGATLAAWSRRSEEHQARNVVRVKLSVAGGNKGTRGVGNDTNVLAAMNP